MVQTHILSDEQLELIEVALLHYSKYLTQDTARARASAHEIEAINEQLLPWLDTPLEVKITNNV